MIFNKLNSFRSLVGSPTVSNSKTTPYITVSRNTIILLILAVFKDGITIPYMAFLTRSLGPQQFGVYALMMTFVMFFMAVLDLGSAKTLTREISVAAHSPQRARIANLIISPRYYLLPALLVVITGLGLYLDYTGIKLFAVSFGTLVAFFMAMAIAGRSIFHAFQRMEYDGVGIVAERAVTITLSVAAITLGFGLAGMLVALLVGQVADSFLSWAVLRRRYAITLKRYSLRLSRPYIKMGFPIFISVFFNQLYNRGNVLVIERYLGDAAVGVFTIAFYFYVFGLYLPSQFAIAIFPAFSRLARQDPPRLSRVWRQAALAMAVLGTIMALLLFLIAEPVIEFVFSADYLGAAQLVKIMAIALPFVFVTAIEIQVIVATNHQNRLARNTILAAIVSISLGVLLIPRVGLVGAAWAAVATELVLFTAYTIDIFTLRIGALPQQE